MQVDELPFWKAIRAAPEDDEPRRVFADWLIERGDPRGELITVQCALDRDPPWSTIKQLRAREAELLKQHVNRWLKPVRAAFSGKFSFRRGLVEHASFSGGAELTPALPHLRREAPLLRGFTLNGVHLQELAGADWVETIVLESGIGLGSLAKLPRLKRLWLPGGSWENPENVARVLALAPLEAAGLAFDAYSVSAAHVEALKRGLAGRKHLRELTIFGLPELGVLSVAGLEQLSLRQTRAAHAELLAMVPELTMLGVVEHDPKQATPRVRVAELLAAANRLEMLRLDGVALDDGEVAALADAPNASRLKRLDLSGNRIGDLGVNALIQSPHLSRLKVLDIADNRLSATAEQRLRAHFVETEIFTR